MSSIMDMDAEAVVPKNVPSPAVDPVGIFLVAITIAVFLIPLFIYFPPVYPSLTDAILQTHSKFGLEPSESRLKKDRKKAKNEDAASSPRIRSLWIYPVKSCRGIELRQSKVLPTGLEFDRLFTFAQLRSPFPVSAGENLTSTSPAEEKEDNHQWEMITQRQFPRLATVEVDLYVPDIIKHKGQPFKTSDAFLVLRFPWQEPGLNGLLAWCGAKLARGRAARPEKEIVLSAGFPSAGEIAARGYEQARVRIWRDAVLALNLEKDLPQELRRYLGVSNRLGLFRVDPDQLREVHRCAPTREEAGYQPKTGFQDAYPLHLLNVSSVEDLNTKVPKDEELQDLDPRRFRANIIIDGAEAYEEETWKLIRFRPGPNSKRQPATFHVSCRTVRCKLPNVNQDTGVRHPVEPDKSLRTFRNVDEGAKKSGCLGMQLTPMFDRTDVPEAMETWVEEGMTVEVLQLGDHVYKSI